MQLMGSMIRIFNVKLFFIYIALMIISLNGYSQTESGNKTRMQLEKVTPPQQASNLNEEVLVEKTLKDLEFKLNFIKNDPTLYREALDKGWIDEMEKAITLQRERLKMLQK